MAQQFTTPTDWKSAKWWNNRPLEERLFHCRIPRKWSALEAELPTEVSKWLESYEEGDSLYITGHSGSGKTAVAVHVARVLLSKSLSGRFVNCEKYLEMIKDSFEHDGLLDPNMYSTPYLLRYIQSVYPVVLLDGVGHERETDFANHEVGSLLRRRNEDMRTTIITTHLNTMSFVRRYGERVSGCLSDMKVVNLGKG
jgi:DNA replication protein DnaC